MRQQSQPRRNNSPLLVDYSQSRATLEIEKQFKKKNKRTTKSKSSSRGTQQQQSRGRSPVKNTKPRRVRSGGNFALRYLGVNSRPREPSISAPTDEETTALLELQNLPQDEGTTAEEDNIKFSVRLATLGVDHLDDLQVSCSDMNMSMSCQFRRRMTRSSSSDDMQTMMVDSRRRRSSSLQSKRKSLRRIKSDNSCATTTTTTTATSGRTRQVPMLPTRSPSHSRRRRSISPLPQKALSNSSLRSNSDHSGLSPSDHERRQLEREERRTSLKLSGLPSIAQEESSSTEVALVEEDASNRSFNLLDASTNSLPATPTPMSASFSKRRARFMNRSVSFGDSATDLAAAASTAAPTTRRGGRRLSPKRSKSTKDKLSNSFNLSSSFNSSFRLGGGGGDDSMRSSMNQSWTSMKSHDMNSSFSFISGSRIRIHTSGQQVSPEAA